MAERAGEKAGAGSIGVELLFPDFTVGGGDVGMFRAGVPEAAVHEDGDAGLAEDEIRPPENGLVTAPAGDAGGAEKTGQGDFSGLVPLTANPGHYFGTLGRGADVSHGSPARRVRPVPCGPGFSQVC